MGKRILITGSHGMLGRQLIETLAGSGKDELMGVDITEGDLSDPTVCREVLNRARPGVVINAAGFTQVDACENPETYPQAYSANAKLPANLARVCKDFNALLIHISTDYVFDGEKGAPYVESDPPLPLNAYGQTKVEGDRLVVESGCPHLIFRSGWMFGRHGKNFVRAVLDQARQGKRLQVVDDQLGSPTSTVDLALAVREGLGQQKTGLFHYCCKGQTTWYDLAAEILRHMGLDNQVVPIRSAQLDLPAKRPKDSRLDCTAFDREFSHESFERRHWKEALEEYLKLEIRKEK